MTNTKNCTKCLLCKPLEEFHKHPQNKTTGRRSHCKSCIAEYRKTPNYIESKRKSQKKYQASTKGKVTQKKHIQNNPNTRLSIILRRRIRNIINRNIKAGSAVRDLGCSIDFLREYLEAKFQTGMTWENHGTYGWHIDHIIPLAAFDLADRPQFLTACHYTNLQPLWAKDNWRKSCNIITPITPVSPQS